MSTQLRSSAGCPPSEAEPAAPTLARIAGVQMASGPNIEGNLNEAARLIARAAEEGATLVALPENFAIMGMNERDKVSVREEEGAGPSPASSELEATGSP